jgi:hypothetical protein
MRTHRADSFTTWELATGDFSPDASQRSVVEGGDPVGGQHPILEKIGRNLFPFSTAHCAPHWHQLGPAKANIRFRRRHRRADD